jgi:RNA polymerase sigma-70 factor (ECF subfamily)
MPAPQRPSSPVSDPKRWTDEELLLDYRRTGNRQVFEILLRRFEREIYAFLRRFLGNTEMAEDAFQATFLAVHLRAHQFDAARKVRPWLYAIATNKAIDFQRRCKRHRLVSLDVNLQENQVSSGGTSLANQLQDPNLGPSEWVTSREAQARMRESLEELPEETQRLIQLAFYQGLKYSCISEILQVPIGTIKSRVHTAMRKLLAIWERKNGEAGRTD